MAVSQLSSSAPADHLTLADQRAFLEALLDASGWTYTIVTDEDAFTRELRSGGYSAYALFSEHEKLDEQVQDELREAVYRGEGLLVAGAHDQRNRLAEALGIEYRGKHAHALGVVLSDSPLHGAGQADFAYEEKALRAELAGALPAGTFLLGPEEENDNGPGSADEPVYDTAVAYYGYGQGKSVYVGFDLLGQATATGDGSLFAELIVSGLDYSHPETVATLPNAVVPVTLTLSNQGMATPGQVTMSLPDGGMIVAAEAGDLQADGSLAWSFGLVETEVQSLGLWVRLPAEAGTVTVDALVQVGTPPDLVDHTQVSLDIAVAEVPALVDVIAVVAALAPEDKEMDKALDALEEADEALLKGDPEEALEELLDAAGELADSGHPEAPALRLQVDLLIRDVAVLTL